MSQVKNIYRQYQTGSLTQKVLDGVSPNLYGNEFITILGSSGSGKMALLNIIGGLDRYDQGDLITNGISTEEYCDRDWDSYQNRTTGFVSQSCNLIPHQTVLANVELVLTTSDIPKVERRGKVRKALEEAGLGNQRHKRPSRMLGEQMQRAVIARVLMNGPDVLLADGLTGALDGRTSMQIMSLLKEVVKDYLVVMVTHGPELAQDYATHTILLRDGRTRSDSNPYAVSEERLEPSKHETMRKSSMFLLTSPSLSFNNLRTKKTGTILTSFAGSIGIIGITLILSLPNGVNRYIQSIEEEALSGYPLQTQSIDFDIISMMADAHPGQK